MDHHEPYRLGGPVSAVTNRYDFAGFPAGGGDPIAYVSMSVPSFQAGASVGDDFIGVVRDFFATQQNVATVVITKVETVSTVI